MMEMKPKCLVLLLYLAVLPVDALLCEYDGIITSLLADIMFFCFVFVGLFVCLTLGSAKSYR